MVKTAPIRTCIACRQTANKQALVRFVRREPGKVELDASGRAAGRGAYVCASDECFLKLQEKQLLAGRLRTKIDKEDYKRLKADFDAYMQSIKASAGDR